MIKTYCFADRIIEIHPVSDYIHEFCREYLVESEPDFPHMIPDFSVTTTQADIDYERAKSEQTAVKEGHAPYHYSDAYLETLVLYRKIAEKIPAYDTFLFHGSAIAVEEAGGSHLSELTETVEAYAAADAYTTTDAYAATDDNPDCIQPVRQAYLFTAKSGTGKSTHARLWREMLGARAVMVNDDKPLIRVTDQGVLAYGTPWDGKHRLSSNICVPLKAVCILEQSPENHIRRITPTEAMPFLLQQVYRPSDPGMLARTLELIDRMAKSVSFYKLACNMDPEAAQLSYHTMVTDESSMPIIERV